MRAKKTPILSFRPDEVIRSAERIEKILRENPSPSREATVNEDNYVQKKVFPEPADVVEEDEDVEDTDSEVNDLDGEA